MTLHQVRGAALSDSRSSTLGTLAQAAIGGNGQLIIFVGILGCVITGDSITGMLRQATWLVIIVTVLVALRIVESALSRRHRSVDYPWTSHVSPIN
ncbi:hypothetical protein QQM39_13090 [Streptomyces sp. DT2A-34]|uniref:hypothetical protein n=1 Tax=Streptomyces sp. DT2A-34 TaxID=3051182 RepID=UPI00265B9EDA|nr:hypothetical protein [Streptomyces sp. DT2A-34]MDO0911752.1 hypothetical protein [Streptomyces sp. DT2A-34]